MLDAMDSPRGARSPAPRTATPPPAERVFARKPSALRYTLGAFARGPRAETYPPIVARWRTRLDERAVDRFLDLTGLGRAETLPSLLPLTFGFRLHMALLTDPRMPAPIWRVLQVRNQLLQLRPVPRRAPLDFVTRIAAQRHAPKGGEVDLHTEVHVHGALHWQSVVTFLVPGLVAPPSVQTAGSIAPEPPVDVVAEWSMSERGALAFGGFTGDFNGIHLLDLYARRFGFRRALYHPSRVLGACLARLPSLPDRHRLEVWLKGPVYRGAQASLRAKQSASALTFALVTTEDPRPCIVGRIAQAEPDARLGSPAHRGSDRPGPR